MKISNKTYDILKYIAIIGIPAIASFISLFGETWGIPYTTKIVATITGLGTLLGALLQISSINYNKKKEGK